MIECDAVLCHSSVRSWVVQFGVSGNPEISRIYNYQTRPRIPGAIIADDVVRARNDVGFVSFSAAYDEDFSCATNRTTGDDPHCDDYSAP